MLRKGSVEESSAETDSCLKSSHFWTKSIHDLINDSEGAQLFLKYLDSQSLSHLLNFWAICNSIRQMDDIERTSKVVNLTYRKFVAPKKSTHLAFRLECIEQSVRDEIYKTLTECSDDINKLNSVFDVAQKQVVEHMSHTSFLKFFESDIYIDYIQDKQNMSSGDGSPSTASTSSSIASCSGVIINSISNNISNSIIEQQNSISIKDANQNIVNSHDTKRDESIDGKVRTESMSKSMSSLQLFSNLSTVHEEHNEDGSDKPISVQKGRESLFDAEPNEPPNELQSIEACDMTRSNVLPIAGKEWNPPTLNRNTIPSSQQRLQLMKPSAPYHAMSSTWNPVSRNDSEIQSQSSGAFGGDTTDDGMYSALTDTSSVYGISAISKNFRQNINTNNSTNGSNVDCCRNGCSATKKCTSSRCWRRREKRAERAIELRNMKRQATANSARATTSLYNNSNSGKDMSVNSFYKPNRTDLSPHKTLEFEDFHSQVCRKLESYLKDEESKRRLNKKLHKLDDDSYYSSLDGRCDNNGRGGGGGLTNEKGSSITLDSDQSILDDHCSRVFNNNENNTPAPLLTPDPERRSSKQRAFPSSNKGHGSHGYGQNGSSFSSSHLGGSTGNIHSISTSEHRVAHSRYNNNDSSVYPGDLAGGSTSGGGAPYSSSSYYQPTGSCYSGGDELMMRGGGANRGYYLAASTSLHHASSSSKSYSDYYSAASGTTGSGSTSCYVPNKSTSSRSSSYQQTPQNSYNQRHGGHPHQSSSHFSQHDNSYSSSGVNSSSSYNFMNNKSMNNNHQNQHFQMSGGGSNQYNQNSNNNNIPPKHSTSRVHDWLLNNSSSSNNNNSQHQQHNSIYSWIDEPSQSSMKPPQTNQFSIVYTFPQSSKDTVPYMTKCLTGPGSTPTLRQVKEMCPKKGEHFRYFFKTRFDDMVLFQEEFDDSSQVAALSSGKVVVECRGFVDH